MLSVRQQQVYDLFQTYVEEKRRPPTTKEVMKDLNISTFTQYYKLRSVLVSKGVLERVSSSVYMPL